MKRLMRIATKILNTVTQSIKPKEEFTYEDFIRLEQKKVRRSDFEDYRHSTSGDGYSRGPNDRIW